MKKLIEWKNSPNRKPLIISGARQVGKTWLMKEFGREYYDKVAYVSFFNNERIKKVFENDFDINRIVSNLKIESNVNISENDTLIILDEIQDCPKALESLKSFSETGQNYHIVAAGSLLGVLLHENISFPVGKVDELMLYPMNFIEFLDALGEKMLLDVLVKKEFNIIKDQETKYIELLKLYYFIGGMPEVVLEYVENKDLNAVRMKQEIILNQYVRDFSKHIKSTELARMLQLWDAIPTELAKENKKFIFKNVKIGARYKEFEIAIEWLKLSGLIYVVNRVRDVKIPLKGYVDHSAFKLYLLDIGLLSAMSELDPKVLIDSNAVFVEYKGALAEQYVAQQLVQNYSLYYYTSENHMYENDFVLKKDSGIVPIEVKSGKNVKSKSLKYFIDKYNPTSAYRFSLMPYEKHEKMINIPLYALSLF